MSESKRICLWSGPRNVSTALMYSFAALLLAVFASLSAFPGTVNVIAICLPLFYFALAIVRYIQLGIVNTTTNQHLDPASRGGELALLLSLMVAEIGLLLRQCDTETH